MLIFVSQFQRCGNLCLGPKDVGTMSLAAWARGASQCRRFAEWQGCQLFSSFVLIEAILTIGKKVSASGDGKMILWDIASGERIRTFEGHDRGLACIEFKVIFHLFLPRKADLILSTLGRLDRLWFE